MRILQIFLFIIFSCAAAVNLPSVRDGIGLARTYHVHEGDDVLITCVVSNVGKNTVSWKREDGERHGSRVLTAGDSRVTADERFSVLHDKGGDVWVLVIKKAFANDSGIYVCEVNSNPVVRSFHKVNVLSRALQPPENVSIAPFIDTDEPKFDAKNHNYTSCCLSRNVTKSCLGFCNIQSILEGTTGQNPENCENDFPDIVKCMADRRNHVPCCIEEGVPDICQDVCRGEYTIITDNIKTHFSCSAYTEQTLACIVEGIELLPSMPEDVEVQSLSDSSLEIKWKPPLANSNSVTAYLVNVTTLRSFDEIEEDSYVTALNRNREDELVARKMPPETREIEVSSSSHMIEVTNLKPFSMYEVTVTAKNDHGTSLPSFAIRSMTLTSGKTKQKVATEIPPQLPDVKACCEEKGVTHASCLDKLCDPVQSDIASVTDLMICAPWAAITFSCLTNGIDLSPCCKARGLPEACQVLCTGNVTQIDFSYFKCLKHMSDFSSCLFQSYGVLPSEPSAISVSNVNSDFAIIHWEMPQSLADTVLYYDLSYRLLATYDNDYKTISKVHSPYVLEKLLSDAEYEVYVKAVNQYGIGKPSSRILFRTKSKIVEAKIEESTSYNVTQCCVDSGLSEICMSLCRYDASMTDIKKLASMCSSGFHILVSCGAGGRNHEKCCTRRGVPAACTTLCSGTIADSLLATATTCIPYIGNIVQCFEEGTDLLPGPITELHATSVTDDSITVAWEPPDRSNVTNYLVYYSKVNGSPAVGNKVPTEIQTNTTNTTVTLDRLESGKVYKIFVVSQNSHGTSLPSTILLINVTKTEIGSGGIKGRPSSPHSLAVSSHSANWVTVSWHPPEFRQFSEAVTYRLYHKQASESEFRVIETSLTSHTIEGLTPNTQYIAYVLAASKSGLSLPSETLIIWTDPAYPAFVEPPTVHPINLVIEGSSMTILCIAIGTPTPTVSLYISGRLVRQETTRHMVTVIHNVTRDMDHISCYADNGYGTPMQTSRRITISHVPHLTAMGITIAGLGDTVLLECQVDAHPEPEMVFWRDRSGKVPIAQEKKHSVKITKNTNEESKWTMGLIIQDITEADEGDYFCHAENAFGSATQPVSVRIRKEAQSGNVTQCCLDHKVSTSCLDACTFFVDVDAVIDRPECLGDFDKLMNCAADGSDHRSCCGQRGVPRRCLDWCRGEPLINNKICVLSYTKQIMSCFQEGRDKLPGPPRNVRMEPIDAHSVSIVWDPPTKNPHTVVMYRVFWRQVGSKTPFKNDTKDNRLTIKGLKEGVTYECVVKAGNHLGTSTLTEPIKFTTGDKYVTSASTNIGTESASVGVIVGMSLAVFIVAALFTGALWFLRVNRRLGRKSAGGVAFENPSYLKETTADRSQVTHSNANSNNVAVPETAAASLQQNSKPENLNMSQATEIPPSFYEELKLGQDGVGFKRLKP